MYVVRAQTSEGRMVVVSAWTDVYCAKFEADRWEQDTKVPHDFVEGDLTLTLPVEGKHAVEAVSAAS